MIEITIDKPNKLANNVLIRKCGFIKFGYIEDVVSYLKNISTRYYHTDTKIWEIPISLISDFCNNFTQYKIVIKGVHTEETVEELAEIPKGYKFKLQPFKHQIEGVRFGLTRKKFLLCDDQGLGKTNQIINWSNCINAKRVLIICGVNSLKYNWQNEVEKHSNEQAYVLGTRFRKNGNIYEGSGKDKLDDLDNLPDSKFIITNVETLRGGAYKEKNKHKFPFVDKLNELIKKGEINAIACDEIHKIKNPNSMQGRAFLKLNAPYLVGMSGTPIMNNALDLFVPLTWLGYNNHSYYAFRNHYCSLGGYQGQDVVGYKNLHEIRELLDYMMLRRLKSDVLDLPPKVHTEEYVDMCDKQKIIYREALLNIKNEINKISFSTNPLSMLIKLRQATGYTGILSDTIKQSAKLDRMVELVQDIIDNGQKVIIMSNWESMTTIAKEMLNNNNIAYITGKVKNEDRMNEVDKFQNDDDCKIIVGTIGAMGTGLTLTSAQNVIFLDEPWNRALKDQAEDRCHRIGTKGTVNIITLITKNTIDERIHDIVYKKGLLSDMVIDGESGKLDISIINELLS